TRPNAPAVSTLRALADELDAGISRRRRKLTAAVWATIPLLPLGVTTNQGSPAERLPWTRFRCFDADTGTWISTDPLEIAGGLALYGFDGSPSDVVDPLGLSVVSKCVSPDTAKQVLEAERVSSGLKNDASHRAASYVSAEQLQAGKEFDLVGGNKVQQRLIQTEGSMDGQAGVFEYIL